MRVNFFVAIIFSLIVTGCTSIQALFHPPIGHLYTNIRVPLKTDLKNTVFNTNQGEADTLTFQYGIWSFSVGDSSAHSAIINACINEVDYAEYEYTNILFGLYQKMTIIVYGDRVKHNDFIHPLNVEY